MPTAEEIATKAEEKLEKSKPEIEADLNAAVADLQRKRKAITDHIDGLYADLKSTANIARSDSRGILLHILSLMKQLAELIS